MERTGIISSNLASIGYERHTNLLEVEFKSKKEGVPGRVFQYHPVNYETYLAVMAADSIGKAFNEKIKSDPNIKYKEMT